MCQTQLMLKLVKPCDSWHFGWNPLAILPYSHVPSFTVAAHDTRIKFWSVASRDSSETRSKRQLRSMVSMMPFRTNAELPPRSPQPQKLTLYSSLYSFWKCILGPPANIFFKFGHVVMAVDLKFICHVYRCAPVSLMPTAQDTKRCHLAQSPAPESRTLSSGNALTKNQKGEGPGFLNQLEPSEGWLQSHWLDRNLTVWGKAAQGCRLLQRHICIHVRSSKIAHTVVLLTQTIDDDSFDIFEVRDHDSEEVIVHALKSFVLNEAACCLLLNWMMDTHEGSMCQTCQLRVSSPENISFLLICVTIRTVWCPVGLIVVVVVTIVLEAAHATRQQGTQCPLVIALRLDRNVWRSLTGHDGLSGVK